MASFLDYVDRASGFFATPAGQGLILGKSNVTAIEVAKANNAVAKPGAGPNNQALADDFARQEDTGFSGLFANPFAANLSVGQRTTRLIMWAVVGVAAGLVIRYVLKKL